MQAAIKKPIPRDNDASPQPWGLARISHRLPGMIGYLKTTALKTRLYVLDSGIQLKHQEFGGRAVWGKNFIDGAPVSRLINTTLSEYRRLAEPADITQG